MNAEIPAVCLKITSFSPIENYQVVGLQVDQDDDNYVSLSHTYTAGSRMELFREAGQASDSCKPFHVFFSVESCWTDQLK